MRYKICVKKSNKIFIFLIFEQLSIRKLPFKSFWHFIKCFICILCKFIYTIIYIIKKAERSKNDMHILIIEDEIALCQSIAEGLRMDGYEIDTCFDGNEGLDLCTSENYDLILLDLNLPGMDGLEILRHFRRMDDSTPVLILSARGQIQDKVEGLDLGANDYITKPFHFEELEARIRSLTRRRFVQENVCLTCGRISFDTRTRQANIDGDVLSLTRKESSLLEYFLLHQNRVISPEELIEHIWDGSVNSFSNSIRVHISSLRKKLRSSLGYDPIQNKIGQGYVLTGND